MYQQSGKGFTGNNLTTLQSISEMHTLYCGKDKTASDCYNVIAAKLTQAN